MYVCNCNGLNCRAIKEAILAGADRPGQIFKQNQCVAQCGRCVGEMRQMIADLKPCSRIIEEVPFLLAAE